VVGFRPSHVPTDPIILAFRHTDGFLHATERRNAGIPANAGFRAESGIPAAGAGAGAGIGILSRNPAARGGIRHFSGTTSLGHACRRPMEKNSRLQVALEEQEDDYHPPALTVSYLVPCVKFVVMMIIGPRNASVHCDLAIT
jgi:hypothetical protein